ncbi:MAG: phosphoribosylglycinamide formyltransferase [Planctomycetes bacterium]|nr:phosphoribosylglycinamide formyltransferase [Planctomycetota bacterium]
MRNPLRLACLVSGSGRTLENLIAVGKKGSLKAVVDVVISSHDNVRAVNIACNAKIDVFVVNYKNYKTESEFSNAITDIIDKRSIDLIVMAGFIRRYLFPDKYEMKIINIHPSLIPKYSGKGFYGSTVHKAVIDNKEKQSGCTVHYASHNYDDGPIILQKKLEVSEKDTVDTLAARVFKLECEALPEAINLVWEQKLKKDT